MVKFSTRRSPTDAVVNWTVSCIQGPQAGSVTVRVHPVTNVLHTELPHMSRSERDFIGHMMGGFWHVLDVALAPQPMAHK